MKYYQVKFSLTPDTQDASDILAALLADIGFEAFQDNLTAWIQQPLLDSEAIDKLLATFPIADTHITYTILKHQTRTGTSNGSKTDFNP